MRIELQPAYILHTRPYRDTSLLVDFFTPDFGRISAIARGVRQRKGNKRQLLNPFLRLLISWQGKTDLKLLTSFESDNLHVHLQGQSLYSGFYLNELLMRLLPEMDPHSEIFALYQDTLAMLGSEVNVEPCLRKFEFQLLNDLGYGLDFSVDAVTQRELHSEGYYRCEAQQGFIECPALVSSFSGVPSPLVFKGADLLAIAADDYCAPETRQAAKQLARMLLRPLLGNRPLQSRELFRQLSPRV